MGFDKYLQSVSNLRSMRNVLVSLGNLNLNILEKSMIVDEYNTCLALNGLEFLVKEPSRIT